jgi:hypothetical protein
MTQLFAIKGRTAAGDVMLIRGGFTSREAAEDYRMVRNGWTDVWIEPVVPKPVRSHRLRRTAAERIEFAFSTLERHAAAGLRCPTRDAVAPKVTSELAAAGRIRIEIYAINWRVVTILTGEHAGKHTMRPADGRSGPHLIIDQNGQRRQ